MNYYEELRNVLLNITVRLLVRKLNVNYNFDNEIISNVRKSQKNISASDLDFISRYINLVYSHSWNSDYSTFIIVGGICNIFSKYIGDVDIWLFTHPDHSIINDLFDFSDKFYETTEIKTISQGEATYFNPNPKGKSNLSLSFYQYTKQKYVKSNIYIEKKKL